MARTKAGSMASTNTQSNKAQNQLRVSPKNRAILDSMWGYYSGLTGNMRADGIQTLTEQITPYFLHEISTQNGTAGGGTTGETGQARRRTVGRARASTPARRTTGGKVRHAGGGAT